MCGIIGAFNFNKNKETVNEDVLNILQDQIQRGKEGFGVTMIDKDNKVKTMRATIPAKAILDLYMNKTKMIVMHHRMPTSSENKISQTHPIEVDNNLLKYKYLVVHNGVVRNCDKLKKEHEAKGYKYTTVRMRQWYNSKEEEYNDSEALAIEAACYIEKQTKGLNIEGSVAFIAIQIDKDTNVAKKIFFGRNDSNPLKLSANKGMIRLSSEGKGDNIKAFHMYDFNLKNFKIHKQKLKFIETPKEYLPDVNTNFHSSNSLINVDNDPFENDSEQYNTDLPENADEKLGEVIENNVLAVDELISNYFTTLSEEESLLKEDTDKLFKNTAKQILIEMRKAKDKAFDAFGEHLYEDTMDKTEAEEARATELEEEKEIIELKGEKLHAK